MTKMQKIIVATIVIWFVAMVFVVGPFLFDSGMEPDRPGHEWDCAAKRTC